MRKQRKQFLALVAAPAAVCAMALASAPAASASVIPGVVTSDHAGIAGYYANNDGQTRIRDAKATFTVTAEMEQLATTAVGTGPVGVDLCNPNNGAALAAALAYSTADSAFEFRWADGTVTGAPDACVDGLAGLEPGSEFTGNVNHLNLAVAVGDTVSVEVYYNPWNHDVTATACDITQDACSQHHLYPGAENWREAGVGVIDNNNACLVPPATANEAVAFSFARFTRYTATGSGLGLLGFDLHSVTSQNAANNVVLLPSALSGAHGSQFSISAGISTCV